MRSPLPAPKLHALLIAVAAAAVGAAACGDGSRAPRDGGVDHVAARMDVGAEAPEAGDGRPDATPPDATDGAREAAADAGDGGAAVDTKPPADAADGATERAVGDDGGEDMRTVGPDTGAGDRPSQPDGSPSDGVLPDAAADMPGGDDAPADGPSGMDADIDSGGDDAGADAGMADGGSGPGPCAEGCPMNVQPQALLLWLSADVGVTCDSTASPPRVSQWLDRARSDHAIKPAAGKLGPQCGGGAHVMSATPIPFFDRPGTDADDGVLVLDLRPMIGSDYTVFVVERRLSANEGYFLGTGINGSATTCGFNAANTSMAYHFGYFSSTSLLAGAYGVDVEMLTYNCTDVTASVPAFSSLNPRTALDVERFSSQSGRALWIGTTSKKTNTDKQPILSLPDGGYLGRAFQTLGTRGSRYVGDIAEVVIYTMALSDDERTAVSTYLMNRWPVTP